MKNEFALAFNEVLEEKQLPKEVILAAIESAMVSAYRRAVNASNAQFVSAKVDPETGKVTIFAEKEVVDEVQDERTEVLLEVARQYKPDAQLGDMALVESTPADFGRVAAQTARQVIQQRIREAERSAQLQYFERQMGEIVSGVVQAINNQAVTLGLDMKAEGVMPANQKIPGEKFRLHDRVRAVVVDVKDGPRGPQIILSRAHRNFLRRLLENEVPEIYHGIVEIRAIAREPGQRAKVAVSATQAGVDPVGACVGVKGVRIQAIVKELHDEKIDIIEWNPDPVIYISKAISPARVTGVYLNEAADGNKTATVVVMEDQLSLAIGRDGQNARLAAKLTGWRIDIKSVVEAAADAIVKMQNDAELAALLPNVAESIPVIEEILAKKAENRPVTPEEYQTLVQFVDRVERRTAQRQEDALKAASEREAAARANIPPAAFELPLEDIGLAEHVYTILTEADFRNAGDLMLVMAIDPNKVLGLPGIGPKAMQNIETTLASLKFPDSEPVAPAVEEAPEGLLETTPAAEAVLEEATEQLPLPAAADEEPIEVEEEAEETLSLDKIFAIPAEALRAQIESDDDALEGKKKGKKGKKSVTYEFDESLGEVVRRKKHKKEDDWDESW